MRWWNNNRWWPFWGSYYYPLTSPSYVAATIGPSIAAQAKAQERAKLSARQAQLTTALEDTRLKAAAELQQKQTLILIFGGMAFILLLIVIYLGISAAQRSK